MIHFIHPSKKDLLFVPPFHLGGDHVSGYNLLYTDVYAKREEASGVASRNLLQVGSDSQKSSVISVSSSTAYNRVIPTCDTIRDRKEEHQNKREPP